MTPQIVHRYAFPIRDAIEALLGDAAGDAEAWQVRVEGGQVVVDVVAPVRSDSRKGCENSAVGPSPASIAPTTAEVTSLPASSETAKSNVPDRPKGGKLARQAGILCNEGGFRVFLDVDTPDDARAEILRRCRVSSRAMLDHDAVAGSLWREIASAYNMWLDGVDP